MALQHKFGDVKPQLLLFLQRLTRLAITRCSGDAASGCSGQAWCEVMTKKQLGPNLVQLCVARMPVLAPAVEGPVEAATAGANARHMLQSQTWLVVK
jgi:hypothetical protein